MTQILNVRHFSLGEGVDERGVPTKILSCNCSLEMEVDNKSYFFGLHIHPPLLEIYFGRLKFASSQGLESYVERASSSMEGLFVGVRNKPMYGAGSSMYDLLESGQGLSLTVQIRIRVWYQIVWGLIKVKHHQVEDCIIILHGTHDPGLHAKMYKSTCFQS
ncbi:hypothetical protein KSP39_PZI012220 [Platanthera zijinensis]|uniref:Uncharacterized protein n=1 Tax=Platanthera zijinensis TaxID=2320716 RepID=A0AAP0BEG4_9ASPA